VDPSASEDADGRSLDPLLEHGVQAVAGHHIGIDTENLADPVLDTHQLDEAELRIVVLVERVDIAFAPRPVPGGRAKRWSAATPSARSSRA
jgi:hypothetical protein